MNKIHTRFPRHSISSNVFSQSIFRIGLFALSAFLLTLHSTVVNAEGSGTWGVTANDQANLMVPTVITINNVHGGGNTGYRDRGFMLLPSDIDNMANNSPSITSSSKSAYKTNYNPAHRFYVWVKNGETVYWGFHQDGSNGSNSVFTWYYDINDGLNNYFPTAKNQGEGRRSIDSKTFNPRSSGTGIPSNSTRAKNGPNALRSDTDGYNAHSFTNNTGKDRAFWLEVDLSGSQGDNQTDYREFNYWDVTVAEGAHIHTGRVYSKYWSVWNSLPNTLGSSNSNGDSFPNDFGFYIPIDNEYTAENDYFVKYANFAGANAGYVVFFVNSDGPGDTGSFSEKRKSKTGTSSQAKYPLFINDPDPDVWRSAVPPVWSYEPVFMKRVGEDGGKGLFTITVNTPCVIDILIDLNGNQVKDGKDVILTHQFTAPGTIVLEWNGKDSDGTDVVPGTLVHFISSIAFFPVHFPIYDMEQSLGMVIKHMRPIRDNGDPVYDVLYWDDSNISESLAGGEPKSNTTGRSTAPVSPGGNPVRQHRWHATGNAGYSNNNTINTWTGAYNEKVVRTTTFNYDVEMDLAVTKTVTPEVAEAGQNVTFTVVAKNLEIENKDGVTATGVEVSDILPDGYTFVSAVVPPGTTWNDVASNPNNKDKWVIGQMEVGDELEMKIIATVKPYGNYLNIAQIAGNESEINYDNNRDEATIKTFKVSGNVFHDPNAGNVDPSMPGGVNVIPANAIYAHLVGSDDRIVASKLVPTGGAFDFNTIPGNFKVALGRSFGTLGQATGPTLPPDGWVHTGTYNGEPGEGNSGNTNGVGEGFTVSTSDVSNINFGIQKPPVTDDSKYSLLEEPVSGITLPLDGTIEAKSNKTLDEIIASDADGQLTTLIITSLAEAMPSGSGTPGIPVLLYDGVPVVLNTPITGFDPAKLSIRLDGGNYVGVFFKFKVIDNGGAESNISTYTVDWLSPLPVKWKSVDVKEENSNAVVSWSTTEELNVDYFEVQYSADARSWQTIGTRKAMNTAKAGYSFTHKLDRNGIHYFRVQSIDLDGSISKSPIVSLKGGKEFAGIVLYPNPVLNGELTMDTQLTNVKHVSIFTTAGVLLKSEAPKSSTLDIRNLPGGVYILQVTYGNGETAAKTFVVR